MTTTRVRTPGRLSLAMGGLGVAVVGVLAAGVVGLTAAHRPESAIQIVLGVALVGLLLADLTVGLVAFLLLQFLALLPVVGGAGSSVKAAGAVLVVTWLVTLVRDRPSHALITAQPALVAALTLFLAFAGLSAVWAVNDAHVALAVWRYALNFTLFAIVFAAVVTEHHARMVAGALAGGAAAAALTGFVLSPESVNPDLGSNSRLVGTIGDPNELAAVLVPGLILAVVLAATTPGTGQRFFFSCTAAVCAAGVFLTLSRGGLLALAGSLVVWTIFGGSWRRRIAGLLAVLAVAGVAYLGLVASPAARERVTTLTGSNAEVTGGGSGRTDIWTLGWRAFEQQPIGGVGAGNFVDATPRQLLKPGLIRRSDLIINTPTVAHNMYLHEMTEGGVVGAGLFMAIIGISLASMWRAALSFGRRGRASAEHLSRGFFAATVGLLLADVFLTGQYEKPLWVMLAMGPALLSIAGAGRQRAASLS